MKRRLAAIMAADIVGYTRLMGADQDGTLSALIAFRGQVFGPTVAAHRGGIIKSMGDGWLVEFDSAVDAVNCALGIQEQLRGHSSLQLRIGLNIGDIVHEHEDIFGDGVNVATRLQEVAPPDGIALSGAVYGSLDGTLSPAFVDAGLHDLKNVARQVHVWLRAPDGASNRPLKSDPGTSAKLARLAILPLGAPDDRPDLSDLAQALTGDLLRLIGSSDWIGPRITGKADPVDYALEGTLRGRAGVFRLDVRLIAPSGELVWSSAFDGEDGDTFTWQDQTCFDIAANVVGGILDMERSRLFDKPADQLTAQDCLDCAAVEFFEISDAALSSAFGYLERALSLDPDLADAHAQAVRCVFAAIVVGYRNRVRGYLDHVAHWLDHAEAAGKRLNLIALFRGIWQYQETAEPAALRETVVTVLRDAPFDPDVLCLSGWSHVWLGEPALAIDCFRKFESLGRFNSLSMAARGGMATALVQAERDHAAIEQAAAILRSTREFSVPFRALASASAHLGRMADAHEAVAEALRLVPGDTLEALRIRARFHDTDANRRFFEGLKAAGYPPG